MSKVLQIISVLLLKHCYCMELKSCKNAPHNQLCKIQKDYDKSKVPGRPLTLLPLTCNILEIAEVDVIEGSIAIFLRLIVNWKDPNISYKPNLT